MKDQLFGYIERITFQNAETGYTVAQLKVPRQQDLVCIVGTIPLVQPGETIRCFGSWKRHLVHGNQFEVTECRLEAPADLVGIKKYLGSGLIKGIGPTYAERIVKKFGTDTLAIIDVQPERLLEVPGLGQKRLSMIINCWGDQKSIRDVMVFLQSHSISPSFAQKIFKAFGKDSIKKIQENPFCLAREIHGVGFKTADQIAQKLGIAKEAKERVESGAEYVLSTFSSEGHVCYPLELFAQETATQLDIPLELMHTAIKRLEEENRLNLMSLPVNGQMEPFVWLRPLFAAEIGIAKEIARLCTHSSQLREVNLQAAIEWVQTQLSIKLADNQKKAVESSLVNKVQIITGGPGTGKSTITNAILAITQKLSDKILLAAPTGRAAKRMSEITKRKAFTIHSLLEFDFQHGGFKRNRDNPLDVDLIIIDEASMIDTYLMYHLLRAIPDHTRVIFVGDINQLPSVGPGNVLKDMIATDLIPITMLNEIFRQGNDSRIVTNAHRINQGLFPDIRNLSQSDFFFLETPDKQDALKQVIMLVTQRLPHKYGYNALQDIQVLAPMKKGLLGTESLNQALQETLHPKKPAFFHMGKKLVVGDKVMQIRNNYNKEVYNGDIGVITEIDQLEQQVLITIDDKEIVYEFSELDEIVLAYAVSVHKYQGSESPCVVMVMDTSHFKLLQRNLFYTGITRGKKLVVLVGTKTAIGMAVKNDEIQKRYTGLQQALIAKLSSFTLPALP